MEHVTNASFNAYASLESRPSNQFKHEVLKLGLKQHGEVASSKQLSLLFDSVDLDKSGYLDLKEAVKALKTWQQYGKEATDDKSAKEVQYHKYKMRAVKKLQYALRPPSRESEPPPGSPGRNVSPPSNAEVADEEELEKRQRFAVEEPQHDDGVEAMQVQQNAFHQRQSARQSARQSVLALITSRDNRTLDEKEASKRRATSAIKIMDDKRMVRALRLWSVRHHQLLRHRRIVQRALAVSNNATRSRTWRRWKLMTRVALRTSQRQVGREQFVQSFRLWVAYMQRRRRSIARDEYLRRVAAPFRLQRLLIAFDSWTARHAPFQDLDEFSSDEKIPEAAPMPASECFQGVVEQAHEPLLEMASVNTVVHVPNVPVPAAAAAPAAAAPAAAAPDPAGMGSLRLVDEQGAETASSASQHGASGASEHSPSNSANTTITARRMAAKTKAKERAAARNASSGLGGWFAECCVRAEKQDEPFMVIDPALKAAARAKVAARISSRVPSSSSSRRKITAAQLYVTNLQHSQVTESASEVLVDLEKKATDEHAFEYDSVRSQTEPSQDLRLTAIARKANAMQAPASSTSARSSSSDIELVARSVSRPVTTAASSRPLSPETEGKPINNLAAHVGFLSSFAVNLGPAHPEVDDLSC